jgi:hypothetical protein
MLWSPSFTWSDLSSTTWSGADVIASQAQSSLGSGSVTISGAATTSQAESATGITVSIGGALESNQGQTTLSVGSLRISGAALSNQAQTAVASAVVTLLGQASSAQAQSSVSVGAVTILGSLVTSNSQSARGSSAQVTYGSGELSQAESLVATGSMMIMGSGATSQASQSAPLAGETTYFGEAKSTTSGQKIRGKGSQSTGRTPVMAALRKLLEYPHDAVFEKSALEDWAISFTGDGGSGWSIKDSLLTITTATDEFPFDLTGVTVAELANAMRLNGFSADTNPLFSQFSANFLMDAEGMFEADRLRGFTSLIWVLMYCYAHEIVDAEYQIKNALRQMVLTQSGGEWLDLWGTLFATPRLAGEADRNFAARIPQEAFRLRSNARAIELAVFAATGKVINIEEPWMDIFVLDESALSGRSKFYDGETIGYHLIRPTSEFVIDWDDVLPVIERNKAAGVIVLQPAVAGTITFESELSGQYWLGSQSWSTADASWATYGTIISSSYVRS